MSVDSEFYRSQLAESQEIIRDLETKLKESQQMLTTILDTIPAYVFWRDLDLKLLGCNRQYAEIAGFKSPEQLIGKTDFDVAPPEFAEQYQADDRQVIESGVARMHYEEGGISPDGGQQWFRTSKMPLHNARGEIVGVLGFFQDVTEQKESAIEKDHLQQQIINAQKLALMELSTPIIPIMDQIIVLPLIGAIDTTRANDIMRGLLNGITMHRAKIVILT